MIRFGCPGCKQVLQAAEHKAGASVQCPGCGTAITVPASAAAAAGQPPPPLPKVVVDEEEASAAPRAGFWDQARQKAGRLARQVDRVTSEVVNSVDPVDDLGPLGGGPTQPAVFLSEQFFGGRTTIGTPFSTMNSLAFWLAGTILSWPFFLLFLRSTSSSWQFLPFSRTEFVRINLRQTIRWRRLLPVLGIWWLGMFLFALLSVVMSLIVAKLTASLGLTVLVTTLTILTGHVLMNLWMCQLLCGLSEKLTRSQITLEYGFPRKHRLLCGYSDAPISQQIDGVLRLCQAIANSQFSRWDQLSTHGGGGGSAGMVGAIYSRLAGMFS